MVERVTEPRALAGRSADWAGARVLVLGLGDAGFAAVDTLVELGAIVLVAAEGARDDTRRLVEMLGAETLLAALEPVPGRIEAFAPQLAIVSPGIAPDAAVLRALRDRGVPVWGDVELAWRLRDRVRAAPWLQLAGGGAGLAADILLHLIATAGGRVVLVGAEAPAVLDAVRDPAGFDALVVQLDERQLRHAAAWPVSPLASVVIDPGTADPAVLGRVYANTSIACVYDRAEPATRRMVEDADVVEGARAIGIGLDAPGLSDLGLVAGLLIDRAFHPDRQHSALELASLGELTAAGLGEPQSVRAALAAAALARALGLGPEAVAAGLASFADRR
ncbi:MAG: hypothetical protein QM635_06560 [Microbacteriaceae bacterium]